MSKLVIDRSVVEQAVIAVDVYIGAQLTVGQRYTNEGQSLLDTLTALRAALEQPVGINGLTEAETGASASVGGLVGKPERPVAFDFQKALRRAYQLGQDYWADADSESYSANKRADKHRQDFEALCDKALAYTAPTPRKPLSQEEIEEAVREADLDWQAGWTLDDHEPNRFTTLARAIERAHGIGDSNAT